ncbi:acyltransferase family protein [Duganella sp. LX20W]|uniref:Acyltransferase family protein n=1 Tax=Rugamonas brunnea TaxID=2758569 RepID=A0A7W2IBV9_9BURK|nr:acyltransferase family protein [Rugamonas brunnea]MBA5637931.1 acyltransferase family protein [Rugamonas brunnea]
MSTAFSPASRATPPRLHFLDWLRICAFLLLILFHTGMYYVTWGWHVKSPYASDAIEPLMRLSSPWRLSLLFLISGVASTFILNKTGVAAFLRQRSVRLLVPLLFGMAVIVPPQSYFEVVEKLHYAGSYGDFLRLYASGYHGFCQDGCLILPTWNHLWFVCYLWVYTVALAAIAALAGGAMARWGARLEQLLTGWKLIALPVAVLALYRIVLAMRFPTTHALIDDWFEHANNFSLFLLGALMAWRPGFWARTERARWAALGLALTCWCMGEIFHAQPGAVRDHIFTEAFAYAGAPLLVVYALCQWSAIVAACGFAHRHLRADGPARRYLTQAVFPVYIVHQTLIVCMAHLLKPAQLAPGLEAAVLIVLTLTISFAAFEVARRFALLRPLFGINGPLPRAEPALDTATAAARPAAA